MTFAYPLILVLAIALIPVMLLLAFRLEKGKQRKIAQLVASPLIPALTESVSPRKKQLKAVLLAVGIALVAAAVARPQFGYVWQEVKSKGIDVVFAIDTSRSMLAEDIKPNRLERAKLAVLDFIDKMGADRIGLVAFSGSAFLQCPLTLDYSAFRQSLEILEPGIIPVGGTDIAAAIQIAENAFNRENNFKILILITDGEDLRNRGIAVAQSAASRGVRVFTLGVGSREGEIIPILNEEGRQDFVRDERGNVVRTRLDESTLQQISAASNGFYSPLGPLGEGLETVYTLGLKEIPRQELNSRMNKLPIERYQWVLAVGILFLILEWLIGTRRSAKRMGSPMAMSGLLLAACLVASPDAMASPYEAQKHLRKGEFVEAEQCYRDAIAEDPEDMRLLYNLGICLFRQGKYTEAINVFQHALEGKDQDPELQADILHNIGNAYYRRGEGKIENRQPETRQDWTKALENYRGSLVIDLDDAETAANRKFVQYQVDNLVRYDLKLKSNFPDMVELKGAGNFDQGIKRPISVTVRDEERYRFAQWEGEGLDDPEKERTKALIDDNKTITAVLVERVKLEVVVVPEEAGASPSSGIYDKDQAVDLKFESAYGWRFIQWEGPGIADVNHPETTITLQADARVVARCEPAKELVFVVDEEE